MGRRGILKDDVGASHTCVWKGDGTLIMGIVDYNSWQESEEGLKLSSTLDRDIVLAEGESSTKSVDPASGTRSLKACVFRL